MTENELNYCAQVAAKIENVRNYLQENCLGDPIDPLEWFTFLSSIKEIQGNFNNDHGFISTWLAKKYLLENFEISFDAAEKPQGAPGIDIDLELLNGARLVAEIKTTVPYQENDFGSNQKTSLEKDFKKLRETEADHKFMLVTDQRAFQFLQKKKYLEQLPGVLIVLLTTGEAYQVPLE